MRFIHQPRTLVFISFCIMLGVLLITNLGSAQSLDNQIFLPILATEPEFEATPTTATFGSVADIANAGDDRLFVAESDGQIQILHPDGSKSTFLDIRSLVKSDGNQEGLFALVFDPNYASNGYFYVSYSSETNGLGVYVSRFSVTSDPDVADPNSLDELFISSMSTEMNNGGAFRYNPVDNFYYLATGDDGTIGNSQNSSSKGKLIRLVIENGALTDSLVVAQGLHNPLRMGVDPIVGDTFIADVGDTIAEEINQHQLGSDSANYGWPCFEGRVQVVFIDKCENITVRDPIYDYDDGCAVTGGEVIYRGSQRTYVFADACNGEISSLRRVSGNWVAAVEGDMPSNIGNLVAFGKNADGEIYVGTSTPGPIYKLFIPGP